MDKTYYHLKMKDEDEQASPSCRSLRTGTDLTFLLPMKGHRDRLAGTLEWTEAAWNNKQKDNNQHTTICSTLKHHE